MGDLALFVPSHQGFLSSPPCSDHEKMGVRRNVFPRCDGHPPNRMEGARVALQDQRGKHLIRAEGVRIKQSALPSLCARFERGARKRLLLLLGGLLLGLRLLHRRKRRERELGLLEE